MSKRYNYRDDNAGSEESEYLDDEDVLLHALSDTHKDSTGDEENIDPDRHLHLKMMRDL